MMLMPEIPDEAYVQQPGVLGVPTPYTSLVCRRIRKMTGDPQAICYEVPNRLAYHARRMEAMAYKYHGHTFLTGLVVGVILSGIAVYLLR